MKHIKIMIVMLALTACGPMIYTKPDITQAQFDRDAYECRQQANIAAMGASYNGTANPFAARETFDQCMRLMKGYTRQ